MDSDYLLLLVTESPFQKTEMVKTEKKNVNIIKNRDGKNRP